MVFPVGLTCSLVSVRFPPMTLSGPRERESTTQGQALPAARLGEAPAGGLGEAVGPPGPKLAQLCQPSFTRPSRGRLQGPLQETSQLERR